MSCTIDLNCLSRLSGSLSGPGMSRQPALPGGSFAGVTARLLAAGDRAAPAVSGKADISMEDYQRTIREKISRMPLSATRQMESISIQISDAAFERMKSDPDYEAWVLSDLKQALSQSNPWVPVTGGGYSVFYVGETKEQCRGEGWYPGYMDGQGGALFEEKARGSFWEQRIDRKSVV